MNQAARHAAFHTYMGKMEPIYRGLMPVESLAVRECGDCNLCCHAPHLSAAEILPNEHHLITPKPAGEKCHHCLDSGGCGIYQKRPHICKGYMCLWKAGLTDKPPMDAGVCWTLQPDMLTGGCLVKGHALDADAVLRDVENREDMRWFMEALQGMHLAAVVIGTPQVMVRFDCTGEIPDLMADVDQTDPMKERVLPETNRRARWSIH